MRNLDAKESFQKSFTNTDTFRSSPLQSSIQQKLFRPQKGMNEPL